MIVNKWYQSMKYTNDWIKSHLNSPKTSIKKIILFKSPNDSNYKKNKQSIQH